MKDLIGQDKVREYFESLSSKNFGWSGSWMFQGPQGVGKFTFARNLAALGLCLSPQGFSACGDCDSCRLIQGGVHPDYFELQHDSDKRNIGIKEVREVQEKFDYKPRDGRYRFFIIDDANFLSVEAQNSLLKLLEEPPDHGVLILVEQYGKSLLPTIRSRCRIVRFLPPELSLVQQRLEEEGLAPEEADRLARESQGCLGLALYWAKTEEGQEEFTRRQEAVDHLLNIVTEDPGQALLRVSSLLKLAQAQGVEGFEWLVRVWEQVVRDGVFEAQGVALERCLPTRVEQIKNVGLRVDSWLQVRHELSHTLDVVLTTGGTKHVLNNLVVKVSSGVNESL